MAQPLTLPAVCVMVGRVQSHCLHAGRGENALAGNPSDHSLDLPDSLVLWTGAGADRVGYVPAARLDVPPAAAGAVRCYLSLLRPTAVRRRVQRPDARGAVADLRVAAGSRNRIPSYPSARCR